MPISQKGTQATQPFMHCLPIVSRTDERPTLSTTNHIRQSIAVYKLVTTNFMEQSASSDGQEIPRVLWNAKAQDRVHKIPPLYTNPVKRHPISLKSPLILSSILRLRTWRWPRQAFHVFVINFINLTCIHVQSDITNSELNHKKIIT